MYYVYVLYSLKDKKFYIGFTNNLKLRYQEHEKGEVISTRSRQPLKFIYFEAYINEVNARKRELFYKSGRGRETLHKILNETLKNLNN
jgi:putative endonuclease